MAKGIYKYTPALQSPETLKSTLMGRDETLKTIVRVLRNTAKGGSISHLILIGPKGIGKTHMLRTIYHCLKGDIDIIGIGEYRDSFVPVIFSEEEYVTNAIKFLRLCIEYLKSERTDIKISDNLTRPDSDERQKELILDFIKSFRKNTGRVLLLLVDNFNDILETFTDEDQSLLRDILMTSESVLLIGTAPTLFHAIVNHGEPFYNFFETEWLRDISFIDTKKLLKKLAELEQRHDILKVIEEKESKLRAIYELSGGNPRLIVSFYQIMREVEITSVEETFQRMLDEMTPYFSARMKDLSAQQREIMDVIAQAETLLTPTEVAQRSGIPVNQVNAQIRRLEEIGYLQKVTGRKRKGVLYDIKERLFGLWRQMRVEAGRKRLSFIIRFVEIWFTKEEIHRYLEYTIKAVRESLSMAPERLKTHLDKLWYLKESVPEYRGIPEEFVLAERDPETALRVLENKIKENPRDYILWWQMAYAFNLLKETEKEIDALKRVVEIKPDMHEAWNNMGAAYADLGRHEEAIEAFRKAVEIKPDKHEAWYNMGAAYVDLGRHEEAIEAFRKAVEIKPDMHEAWNNMGVAYIKPGKFTLAINALKKAISLRKDEHLPWKNLMKVYLKLYNRNFKRSKRKAKEYLREALNCIPHAGGEEKALEVFTESFMEYLLNGKIDTVRDALEAIKESPYEDLKKGLHPFYVTIEYFETKDETLLERIKQEERLIVNEMLTVVKVKMRKRR